MIVVCLTKNGEIIHQLHFIGLREKETQNIVKPLKCLAWLADIYFEYDIRIFQAINIGGQPQNIFQLRREVRVWQGAINKLNEVSMNSPAPLLPLRRKTIG